MDGDERQSVGPVGKLLLELVGGLAFYGMILALQAMQDPTSPLRLWLADASEELDDIRARFREARFRLEIEQLERMVNQQ